MNKKERSAGEAFKWIGQCKKSFWNTINIMNNKKLCFFFMRCAHRGCSIVNGANVRALGNYINSTKIQFPIR